jgi:hypothetical protein
MLQINRLCYQDIYCLYRILCLYLCIIKFGANHLNHILMKGDKLFRVLKTFSKSEIKEFRKYLSSTFLSEGRNHVAFFDKLMKFYPDFEKKKTSIEALFKDIKNPETLHFTISHIIKLAYDYLYFKHIREDKVNKYIELSQITKSRGLSGYALNFINDAEKALEEKKIDKEYYYNMHRIYMEKIVIYFRLGDLQNQFTSGIKMTEYFSIYLMGQIVRLQDILRTYEGNYDFDYRSTYLSYLINSIDFQYSEENIEKLMIEKTSFVKIYGLLFSQIKNERNDKYFQEIYKNLEKGYDELAPYEIATIATKLQNDLLWINKRKIDNFLPSYFEAIKKYVLNIYNINKVPYFKMDANTFRNIYLTAIELDELEWAEEFIEKYGKVLYPEKRDDMVRWAYGMLYFRKKEFEKSLYYLNSVKDVVDMFKFDIRRDILKLYYELKYYDNIPALIDSFRHFLSNTQTLNTFTIAQSRKFIEYFSKLHNCTITKDISKIRYLQKQVENDKAINNDTWLKDKLKELLNSV